MKGGIRVGKENSIVILFASVFGLKVNLRSILFPDRQQVLEEKSKKLLTF